MSYSEGEWYRSESVQHWYTVSREQPQADSLAVDVHMGYVRSDGRVSLAEDLMRTRGTVHLQLTSDPTRGERIPLARVNEEGNLRGATCDYLITDI